MNLKIYHLVNSEGCTMHTIVSTTFRKARENFSHEYSGKYRIYCKEEYINVRLK